MNISIAVIQNLFLLFPQENIFFLKKYFLPERLTISLPSFSNPIQSRAILKGSWSKFNTLHKLICSKLWKWIQKEEEQPIIGATTLNINGQENFSGQILTTKIRSIYVMLKKLFGDYIRVPFILVLLCMFVNFLSILCISQIQMLPYQPQIQYVQPVQPQFVRQTVQPSSSSIRAVSVIDLRCYAKFSSDFLR